jgi:hypothetical protein
MKKECKIVCDGKDVAIIKCDEDGLHIKHTKEGKEMCKGFHECCQ